MTWGGEYTIQLLESNTHTYLQPWTLCNRTRTYIILGVCNTPLQRLIAPLIVKQHLPQHGHEAERQRVVPDVCRAAANATSEQAQRLAAPLQPR